MGREGEGGKVASLRWRGISEAPMTPLFLTVALLASSANQAVPSDTLRYIILQAGNPAGSELAVRNPDGSLYFFEEYNDRGRGPRLETRITLTPAGTFRSLAAARPPLMEEPEGFSLTLPGHTARWGG